MKYKIKKTKDRMHFIPALKDIEFALTWAEYFHARSTMLELLLDMEPVTSSEQAHIKQASYHARQRLLRNPGGVISASAEVRQSAQRHPSNSVHR